MEKKKTGQIAFVKNGNKRNDQLEEKLHQFRRKKKLK